MDREATQTIRLLLVDRTSRLSALRSLGHSFSVKIYLGNGLSFNSGGEGYERALEGSYTRSSCLQCASLSLAMMSCNQLGKRVRSRTCSFEDQQADYTKTLCDPYYFIAGCRQQRVPRMVFGGLQCAGFAVLADYVNRDLSRPQTVPGSFLLTKLKLQPFFKLQQLCT
jgi:hypothetical protein